jgi:hypothetical protein
MEELGICSGGARACGKEEDMRLPCMVTMEANHRALGVQQGGQGGTPFGLLLGQIGPWAQNKVCCTLDALQISLRDHDH